MSNTSAPLMSPPRAGARPQTTKLGTLLCVWAHPDDEAFLSAGLMLSARAMGHRVVVATATRGEHGTADPTTWPPERLARRREGELAASLAALDVTSTIGWGTLMARSAGWTHARVRSRLAG